MRRPALLLPPLLAGAAILALGPGEAAAHIEITSHVPRHGPETQKAPPCGVAGAEGPGATVYTYAPGETITLAWYEFINHPGHYRVAFDAEGDDDFVDPATASDLHNNDAVLLDGIPDEADVHEYEVEVTLPDVECETCTIQILQIMTDKPPFGDGNDIYYHCVDLRLVAEGGDGDGDPGDGDGDPEPGDGDGDPGDGDPEPGATETDEGDEKPGDTGETGAPADEAPAGGCACASTPKRPRPAGATPLALLLLGLLRRPKGRRPRPPRTPS